MPAVGIYTPTTNRANVDFSHPVSPSQKEKEISSFALISRPDEKNKSFLPNPSNQKEPFI